jgi:hypothetical protein
MAAGKERATMKFGSFHEVGSIHSASRAGAFALWFAQTGAAEWGRERFPRLYCREVMPRFE